MAQLLDQFGNPVKPQELTREHGEPGITSVRQAWAPSMATGLTPIRLAGILRNASEGDLHDYLLLAEEMEEKDPHYSSVLGVRKRAISGAEVVVTPASDSAADKKIAQAVSDHIVDHDGFSDLLEDMLDALGKGFSQIEIQWRKAASAWSIEEFIYRDPRFFTFDRETGREVRLIDERDVAEGIPLAPYKWISHKAKLKSGLPARGGLSRLVAFGWICKNYTLKDWMAFVETYGLPLRIGRYGPQATPDDVQTLFRAVANIGTDAAAILPESMRIDFEGLTQGTGDQVFERLARWVDEQTSKAVLGQTMTSDNGSSQSQAEVHNEVRHDIAVSDARAVSGTLNRDLVRPYVDLNFGVQPVYPKLKIVIDDVEDVDMIMRNVFRMSAQGVRFKQSEIRLKLGFEDPDEDDETIGGAAPATEIATNRAETISAPKDDLDLMEADDLSDWEAIMGDFLDPIIELIETAEDYSEALDLLAQAFPKMKDQALIERLVKSAFKARALGDHSDG